MSLFYLSIADPKLTSARTQRYFSSFVSFSSTIDYPQQAYPYKTHSFTYSWLSFLSLLVELTYLLQLSILSCILYSLPSLPRSILHPSRVTHIIPDNRPLVTGFLLHSSSKLCLPAGLLSHQFVSYYLCFHAYSISLVWLISFLAIITLPLVSFYIPILRSDSRLVCSYTIHLLFLVSVSSLARRLYSARLPSPDPLIAVMFRRQKLLYLQLIYLRKNPSALV